MSRYKSVFPATHCHLALSSAAPPALADLRAADADAAAAAAGEAGCAAPVVWAAVLNGDVALYRIGQADLIGLM